MEAAGDPSPRREYSVTMRKAVVGEKPGGSTINIFAEDADHVESVIQREQGKGGIRTRKAIDSAPKNGIDSLEHNSEVANAESVHTQKIKVNGPPSNDVFNVADSPAPLSPRLSKKFTAPRDPDNEIFQIGGEFIVPEKVTSKPTIQKFQGMLKGKSMIPMTPTEEMTPRPNLKAVAGKSALISKGISDVVFRTEEADAPATPKSLRKQTRYSYHANPAEGNGVAHPLYGVPSPYRSVTSISPIVHSDTGRPSSAPAPFRPVSPPPSGNAPSPRFPPSSSPPKSAWSETSASLPPKQSRVVAVNARFANQTVAKSTSGSNFGWGGSFEN